MVVAGKNNLMTKERHSALIAGSVPSWCFPCFPLLGFFCKGFSCLFGHRCPPLSDVALDRFRDRGHTFTGCIPRFCWRLGRKGLLLSQLVRVQEACEPKFLFGTWCNCGSGWCRWFSGWTGWSPYTSLLFYTLGHLDQLRQPSLHRSGIEIVLAG